MHKEGLDGGKIGERWNYYKWAHLKYLNDFKTLNLILFLYSIDTMFGLKPTCLMQNTGKRTLLTELELYYTVLLLNIIH